MATHETELSFLRVYRYPIVVLIGAVDRRIVPTLRFVSELPQTAARALHVSLDPVATQRLAIEWMHLGLDWLPLHIHEATGADLLASVRDAVIAETSDVDRATVVVPELDFYRWWHQLLHRRNARRIAQQLQALPGVTAVIVPFSAAPPSR